MAWRAVTSPPKSAVANQRQHSGDTWARLLFKKKEEKGKKKRNKQDPPFQKNTNPPVSRKVKVTQIHFFSRHGEATARGSAVAFSRSWALSPPSADPIGVPRANLVGPGSHDAPAAPFAPVARGLLWPLSTVLTPPGAPGSPGRALLRDLGVILQAPSSRSYSAPGTRGSSPLCSPQLGAASLPSSRHSHRPPQLCSARRGAAEDAESSLGCNAPRLAARSGTRPRLNSVQGALQAPCRPPPTPPCQPAARAGGRRRRRVGRGKRRWKAPMALRSTPSSPTGRAAPPFPRGTPCWGAAARRPWS